MAAAKPAAEQLHPRLKGVIFLGVGVLLLWAGIELKSTSHPEYGEYYSAWVLVFIAINLLTGFGMISSGLWQAIAGPKGERSTGLMAVAIIGIVVTGLIASVFGLMFYDLVTQPYFAGEEYY